MPTASFAGGSCAPMENSPPGIHAIPGGAEPAGGFLFSTVGAKLFVAGGASAFAVFTSLFAWTACWLAYFQIPNPAASTARNAIIFKRFGGKAARDTKFELFLVRFSFVIARTESLVIFEVDR